MNFLERARRLESKIARRLDSAAQGFVGSGAREPLETLHAIVEAVCHEAQPGGRGTHVFPFNRIAVTVAVPSPAARAHFEALFSADPSLRNRLLEHLRSRRCDAADLLVDVKYVGKPQKGWTNPDFHVGFARAVAAVPVVIDREAKPLRLEITVLNGAANYTKHSFDADRVDLGRCDEVRDSRHRLIRRNDLAFAEGAGDVNRTANSDVNSGVNSDVNSTVSRQHAHISCDRATGHHRVYDDGSAHGTSVVRAGRTVAVPAGARGVRLQSGDEIVLGAVRLQIRLHCDES